MSNQKIGISHLDNIETREGKKRSKDHLDFRLPLEIGYKVRSLGVAGTTQSQIVKNMVDVIEKYPFIKNEIFNRSLGIFVENKK